MFLFLSIVSISFFPCALMSHSTLIGRMTTVLPHSAINRYNRSFRLVFIQIRYRRVNIFCSNWANHYEFDLVEQCAIIICIAIKTYLYIFKLCRWSLPLRYLFWDVWNPCWTSAHPLSLLTIHCRTKTWICQYFVWIRSLQQWFSSTRVLHL